MPRSDIFENTSLAELQLTSKTITPTNLMENKPKE